MVFDPKFVEISANLSTDFHWILIHGHIAGKGLTPDLPALRENVIYRSHKDQPQLRASCPVVWPSIANDGKRHSRAGHWTLNTGHTVPVYGVCLHSLFSMCVVFAHWQSKHITCPLGILKTKRLHVRFQVTGLSRLHTFSQHNDLSVHPRWAAIYILLFSCTSLIIISRVHDLQSSVFCIWWEYTAHHPVLELLFTCFSIFPLPFHFKLLIHCWVDDLETELSRHGVKQNETWEYWGKKSG